MAQESFADVTRGENTVEQNIKAIWQEALRIPEVPDDVTFLDLRGDSLSAMVCIARMRTLFNVEFTIEDFFMDGCTVSEFTRMIKETLSGANAPF